MNKILKHLIIVLSIFTLFSLIFFIFLNSPEHWNGVHTLVPSESFTVTPTTTTSPTPTNTGGTTASPTPTNTGGVTTSPTLRTLNVYGVLGDLCSGQETQNLVAVNKYSFTTFFNFFYFCSTTFSSVGYGDMSPKSKTARGIVMLLHLALTAEYVNIIKDIIGK